MRLHSLTVNNFKSFSAPVHLEFEGVNLFYGANSAGKSSLFQALLLLKQSNWKSSSMRADDLEVRGPLIDLGGFRSLISEHDLAKELQISLEMSGHYGAKGVALGDRLRYSFTYKWDEASEKPVAHGVEIQDVVSRKTVRFARRDKLDGLRLLTETDSKTLLDLWLEARPAKAGPPPSAEDVSFVRGWLRRTPTARLGWIPYWSPREFTEKRPGRPVGGSLNSSKRLLLQEVLMDWQSWAWDIDFSINYYLDRISYVGPLRQAPRRSQIEGGSVAEGMGARGERAARLLAKDEALLERVNLALAMLEIPYELSSESVGSPEIHNAIGEINALLLRDTRSGVVVTPGDVGFGISQVLPVVLQLLLTRHGAVMIEQPEIHLHPRLQSRLADVILASTTLRKNQVFIETHSEHLLLRLQRRIRSMSIDAGDVRVSYLEQGDEGTTVIPIEIDRDGSMLTPWPDGFFDERLEDIMASDENPVLLDSRLAED